MALVDLFGGQALKARIAELYDEVSSVRAELTAAAEAHKRREKELEAQLSERQTELETARKSKKNVQSKLQKVQSARTRSDRKTIDLDEQIAHLKEELGEFRNAVLAANARAEEAILARQKAEQKLASYKPPTRAPQSEDDSATAAPRPSRTRDPDERVARLREQLDAAREANRALKNKVSDAERLARQAEKKSRSEIGKAESVVRDLRHNLRSERTAYRTLQLQYQTQVDRVKGMEQQIEARIKAAIKAASVSAPPVESEQAAQPTPLPDPPLPSEATEPPPPGAFEPEETKGAGIKVSVRPMPTGGIKKP